VHSSSLALWVYGKAVDLIFVEQNGEDVFFLPFVRVVWVAIDHLDAFLAIETYLSRL
jgi:hypothetical protein